MWQYVSLCCTDGVVIFGITLRSKKTQLHHITCLCRRREEAEVKSTWNVMAHGDPGEGKWRGNWRMEWVPSTLHTTSEHAVSNITTTDAHTSAASSRLNWRPRRFKWTRPFHRKTKSGFCACAITFQRRSTAPTHSRPGTRSRWVVSTTLWPPYPREHPVLIVEQAGWAPGPVWTAMKISPPPEFDTRTVEPVAIRRTDWAIPAARIHKNGTRNWESSSLHNLALT
jgi:hypothetical protein